MFSDTKISRLGHVALSVTDLKRSQDFYCKVLGLEIVIKYKEMIVLLRAPGSGGAYDLALLLRVIDQRNCNSCLNHYAWQVESFSDLQEFYNRFRSLGYSCTIIDHGIELGVYISDPDGYKVEIFHRCPVSEWDKVFGSGATNCYPHQLREFGDSSM